MDAKQLPGKMPFRRTAVPHHDGCAAGSPMCPSVREEKALPLKPHTERGSHCRKADHRQVMNRVMESQRKACNKQVSADLHLLQAVLKVLRGETVKDGVLRQDRSVDFNDGHVHIAKAIRCGMPGAESVGIEWQDCDERPGVRSVLSMWSSISSLSGACPECASCTTC